MRPWRRLAGLRSPSCTASLLSDRRANEPVDGLAKLDSVSGPDSRQWAERSRYARANPPPTLFLSMDFVLNLDFRAYIVDTSPQREYGGWCSPPETVGAQWP
jgi:hypothetical protein